MAAIQSQTRLRSRLLERVDESHAVGEACGEEVGCDTSTYITRPLTRREGWRMKEERISITKRRNYGEEDSGDYSL